MPAARDVEAERIAIERFRSGDVADAQMHVADAQAAGRARIGRAGRTSHDIFDVERIGGHLQVATGPLPGFRRPVAIDLDAVALGIVEVERLAHRVIGGAGQRHLVARHMHHPARQIGARRHAGSGVIEARGAQVVGLGVGAMLEMEERHVAAPSVALSLPRSSTARPSTSLEAGKPGKIAHFEGPTAPTCSGVRLAKVGMAEGLGASMELISAFRGRFATRPSCKVAAANAALL